MSVNQFLSDIHEHTPGSLQAENLPLSRGESAALIRRLADGASEGCVRRFG
ncbi:MAG: hypothetical protein WDZ36_05210 [Balneolaceae bacterium]